MELIKLNTKTRTTMGNGPARALRREGQIPAILYGPQTEATMLAVDGHEMELALKKSQGSQLFLELTIDGDTSASHPAMVKELQTHPVSRALLHVDFYKISMDRKIRVNVPVVTVGKSAGVELGGILQLVRRELEIMCLPGQIPDAIEIDITDLEIGGSIHINDIKLSDDIEFMEEGNYTVVTVLSPTIEEVEEEAEGEEGEEAEEGEAEAGEAAETTEA